MTISELQKEIKKLEEIVSKELYCPSMNEMVIRRNQEAWLEYYKKKLNALLTNT